MIKARGMKGAQEAIFLGLSQENVARLFANEPIVLDTASAPPRGLGVTNGPVIVLFAGTDEATMLAKMRTAGLVTHETHVQEDL